MVPDVNAHIHTPYSFSAFGSVSEALDRAAAEGVRIVGINDFYSTDGFREWHDGCAERRLYPLYGIEFMALDAICKAHNSLWSVEAEEYLLAHAGEL